MSDKTIIAYIDSPIENRYVATANCGRFCVSITMSLALSKPYMTGIDLRPNLVSPSTDLKSFMIADPMPVME